MVYFFLEKDLEKRQKSFTFAAENYKNSTISTKRKYMKKNLIILLSFISLGIYAQDNYRPFVEEGKSWKYYIEATTTWWDGKEMHWDEDYGYSTLTIKGDTVVDNLVYKKVIHDADHGFFWNAPFLYGIIRENNKKVYMRFIYPDMYDTEIYEVDDFSEEILMYDFNLNVGDIFNEDYENYGYGAKVNLTSIEENDGKRIYNFSPNKDWWTIKQWVEGAGGFHGLGLEQRTPIPTCIECTRFQFLSLSCYLGDECLCTFDQSGSLVLGIEEIKAEGNPKSDKSVYDLQGRKLPNDKEIPHGIYIRDGKKIAR